MAHDERPVRKGDRLRVRIDALALGGDGIARVDDYVLFVPGGAPGDTATVEVTGTRATYGKAHIVSLHEAGTGRVEPACSVYTECGGCQLMHLAYAEQLAWKERFVRDSLQRIGGLENPEVLPVIGMDHPWAYRNKAQFTATVSGSKLKLGFFRRGSHDVVATEKCAVQDPLITRIVASARDLANDLDWTAYDEKEHAGLLRHVVVRTTGWAPQHGAGMGGREALVVLVINGEGLPRERVAARRLHDECPEVAGVVKNINRERTNRVLGDREVVIEGRGFIVDTLGSLSFRISAGSFYQVNPLQTVVLYDQALYAARLKPTDRVLDLYCGIGTISLYAARHCASVTGIEVVESAVRDARDNAHRNNISNAEFVTGRVEELLPDLATRGEHFEVVIVDPPRKGITPAVLEAVCELSPNRLVYVSCNPATLARDMAGFSEAGFRPGPVQPVDMFPHTTHVECVVLLSG